MMLISLIWKGKFSFTGWCWYCIFCTNSHYHNTWTRVRSCYTRVWSGSEAHRLINATSWFLNYSSTCTVFWPVKFVAWFIDHDVQQKEGRSGQMETGPLLLRQQLSLQEPKSGWSFLWNCPFNFKISCPKICTSWIWSKTSQCFWSQSQFHHLSPFPKLSRSLHPLLSFHLRLLPFPPIYCSLL